LCKLLLERHNLLILDEPTNHLDITTKDMFQEALKKYKGTLLIVTHDRYFLDELVHKVIEIRDHKSFLYPGNYSYFIEKRASMLKDNQVTSSIKDENITGEITKKQNTSKEQKRKEAEKRNSLYQYKKEIQEIEKEIATQEEKITELENTLCSEDIYSKGEQVKDYINNLKNLKNSMPSLYDRWHQAQEKLEEEENRESQ